VCVTFKHFLGASARQPIAAGEEVFIYYLCRKLTQAAEARCGELAKSRKAAKALAALLQ
jgi:hypothetical protein